jgi:hypothetical protein
MQRKQLLGIAKRAESCMPHPPAFRTVDGCANPSVPRRAGHRPSRDASAA